MHEFIQGGELKMQAKRLLGYRMPLVLVIIVNVVLIARVPLPAVRQAQAQAPASSSWTELDAQLNVPQLNVPVPELAQSLAQPAPAADTLDAAHDATAPDTTPSADAGLAIDAALVAPPTSDSGLSFDTVTNAARNRDATRQPELSPPAALAADDQTAVKPSTLVLADLSTDLLGNWQQDAQQLVQNWRDSAHSLLSQQSVPNAINSTASGTEDGSSIDLTTPALEIVIPAELSSSATHSAEVPEHPSMVVEPALNETSLAVRNPMENAETIRFLVNSRLCELQPGEAHQFPPAEQWLVQFHPGGEFQDVDRTVTTGVYQFVITQQGWDLVPVATAPVATDRQ